MRSVAACHQHAEERELDPFYEALVGKPHPGCQAMSLKVIHWDDWEGVLVAESLGKIDAHFQAPTRNNGEWRTQKILEYLNSDTPNNNLLDTF